MIKRFSDLLPNNQFSPQFYFWVILFLGLTYTPLIMHEKILDAFVREDHIFETLTFVYFIVIGILFLYAFLRIRSKTNHNNLYWLSQLSLLGLALLFFVGAGEEISWGQRLFKIETPTAIKEINAQEELTIHNLNIFQGEEAIMPLDLSQLSTAFIFIFGLIIPLLCNISKKSRTFFSRIMPIMPLTIGYLFIVNYLFQKFIIRFLPNFSEFYLHTSMPIPVGIHEIREHGYAFLLMLSSAYYVINLFPKKLFMDEIEITH